MPLMIRQAGNLRVEELVKQAASLQQAGNLAQLQVIYQELCDALPGNAEFLRRLGALECRLGNLDVALQLLSRSLLIDPNDPYANDNRGLVYQRLHRFGEALASHDRAVECKPDFADAYINRGNVLIHLERPQEALNSYDLAIRHRPDSAYAHSNRAVALRALGRMEEALAEFDRALAICPDLAEAHNNRGFVLRRLNRFSEALASCDRALAKRPTYLDALLNRGNALKELRRFAEACATYDRAIAIKADCADAYWNKALVALQLGNFNEGWDLYEWRWRRTEAEKRRNLAEPLWLGRQSLQGKTLLIYPEQGFGDYVQFCRYAASAIASGAKVVLEAPAPLTTLVSTMKGNLTVLREGAPLPAFDFQCPIMSLPLAFGTTLETVPGTVPYLFPPPAKVAAWRSVLGSGARLRVGLAWSGRREQENDHNRSIPLALIAPLLDLPFEFHCLQKQVRAEDAQFLAGEARIALHSDNLDDFSDTAALIEAMDLVVAVDTSVAHVAGAIGKPVWILLSFAADYRWLLDRPDCPWYPTATLFRQPALDDWKSVLSDVAARLAHCEHGRSPHSGRFPGQRRIVDFFSS
jgi:tetratricopeptide (TPR) repeat protein